MDRVVIAGAGLTAAKAAETLREEGYSGGLTVVGREAHLPYERPPLSKDYLRGEAARDNAFPLDAAWYASHDVAVLTGTVATGLDVSSRTLALDDGRALGYDALLLATGSSPRHLGIPGTDLDGVHVLRTLDDSEFLAAALRTARGGELVVVGDGWIGLEVAASARTMGVGVRVIGLGTHPLERVLGARMGEFFGSLHAEHGVRLHPRAEVAAVTGENGTATGVALADGTHVAADVVLVAVGAVPNLDLPRAAGLRLDPANGGVVVSRTLRTTAPGVFAAGDIASVPNGRYGHGIRVEHWATALHQGPHAGRAILGSDEPYDRLPYFFTDQYDVGMEYLGYVTAPDAGELVVSGSVADREFVAFWVREDPGVPGLRVDAGMTVNVWDRMESVEELIRRDSVGREELERFVG